MVEKRVSRVPAGCKKGSSEQAQVLELMRGRGRRCLQELSMEQKTPGTLGFSPGTTTPYSRAQERILCSPMGWKFQWNLDV